MKKQTWQKRNGSYIFHHFDARIDSPHKSLTPPSSSPLLSLSLSPHPAFPPSSAEDGPHSRAVFQLRSNLFREGHYN